MTDWQPIETAPKDGKIFLGAKNLGVGYGWSRYICCWSEFKKSFRSQFGIPEGGMWYPLDGKNTPSHWMPLPEPPNAQEAYTAKATLDSEREANKILTDEIERLRKELKESNANHELYERRWYLRENETERLREELKELSESIGLQREALLKEKV